MLCHFLLWFSNALVYFILRFVLSHANLSAWTDTLTAYNWLQPVKSSSRKCLLTPATLPTQSSVDSPLWMTFCATVEDCKAKSPTFVASPPYIWFFTSPGDHLLSISAFTSGDVFCINGIKHVSFSLTSETCWSGASSCVTCAWAGYSGKILIGRKNSNTQVS